MAVRAEAEYRSHPAERWNEMVRRLYPTSPAAQRKGGPRSMFLGLCAAGLVKGVPAGQYGGSNKAGVAKAKAQAVRAVALLREGMRGSATALWMGVTEGGTDSAHLSDGRGAGAVEERTDCSVNRARGCQHRLRELFVRGTLRKRDPTAEAAQGATRSRLSPSRHGLAGKWSGERSGRPGRPWPSS